MEKFIDVILEDWERLLKENDEAIYKDNGQCSPLLMAERNLIWKAIKDLNNIKMDYGRLD